MDHDELIAMSNEPLWEQAVKDAEGMKGLSMIDTAIYMMSLCDGMDVHCIAMAQMLRMVHNEFESMNQRINELEAKHDLHAHHTHPDVLESSGPFESGTP